jgi:hypothetical protein
MGTRKREGTTVRKTAILTLCVTFVIAVLAGGCATGAKGPSDEELIASTLANWKMGMEQKNVEMLKLAISDEFDHYEYGNKDQMIGFLSGAFTDGTLDSAKVSLETAETKIDGKTANVYPVELVAAFGSATIGFTMTKEDDGQWRATSMVVEGV